MRRSARRRGRWPALGSEAHRYAHAVPLSSAFATISTKSVMGLESPPPRMPFIFIPGRLDRAMPFRAFAGARRAKRARGEKCGGKIAGLANRACRAARSSRTTPPSPELRRPLTRAGYELRPSLPPSASKTCSAVAGSRHRIGLGSDIDGGLRSAGELRRELPAADHLPVGRATPTRHRLGASAGAPTPHQDVSLTHLLARSRHSFARRATSQAAVERKLETAAIWAPMLNHVASGRRARGLTARVLDGHSLARIPAT